MEWLFHIKYDIDFFLAAIPLQLIMIIYYISRRHLPLRESSSFFYLMVLNLLTLVTDIIACAVLAVSPPHTGAIYFWNIFYYTCFILSAFFLLLYTSDALHIPDFAGRWTKALLFLPAWVLLALLFTTPWTGYFFQSTPLCPYKNGPVYMGIYGCYIFYLVLSMLLVLLKWNENSLKRNLAFIACGCLLLIGIYLRNEFRQILILGYFFTLAILVGYLTVRNPDFYMDEETNLLNAQAMKLVYQDRMREGNASWFGFVIRGFEQSRILYGSVFVDSFLKDIGDFIRRELGSCHGFYLRGGRFVILTPSAKLTAEAEQHIKERFQKPWVNGERTAFFDISCVTSGGDIRLPSLEEFLLVLEDSLQAAKLPEVGSLVVNKGVLQKIKHKFHVHRLLMAALESNSLEVYLQPLVETGTGRLLGAEALVRLKDSDGSIIMPGEFVPYAEDNGSITLLGLEVFGKVCRFIHEGGLQRCGMQWIQVNLSPLQCLDRSLPDKLDALRHEYDVPASQIRLEITERAAFGSIGYQRIQELKQRGYAMVLDDYGSGYSNSYRLRELPVTGIKLGKSFVDRHFEKPDSYLPHLIQSMRQAGYEVTAEGVENGKMAKSLADMGCSSLQGSCFSIPVPMALFLKTYGSEGKAGRKDD